MVRKIQWARERSNEIRTVPVGELHRIIDVNVLCMFVSYEFIPCAPPHGWGEGGAIVEGTEMDKASSECEEPKMPQRVAGSRARKAASGVSTPW